ncbi:hypothetical protein E4O05_00835 [Treponema sp. OMZ 787]|uniref:hypothetical protein n=1 Tax=Treponema sp. OMZ 787 TaxID=2563669 RepID=UPI0020A309A0|nr:hypothetical protein [Treponema sp. OMZ 787]UTC62492.1 hypothetical protein E4O05_00835 [Treponema sp. OMZ 787]
MKKNIMKISLTKEYKTEILTHHIVNTSKAIEDSIKSVRGLSSLAKEIREVDEKGKSFA